MLPSEYFMIVFVFLLGLFTIFYIFYHIKHHTKFSDERIENFKKIALSFRENNYDLPFSLKNKLDMFLKYIEEKAENNVFEIERNLGIELEVLEKRLNNFIKTQKKGKNMDYISLKKEIYKDLATSLLGVLSFVSNKKVLSKTVYFVCEPNGNTFLMSRLTDEILDIKNNDKVSFAVVKEGVTASESREIIIEGSIKVIDYDNNELWARALELFKKKSPFLANIEVLGKKKEYILLCLYPAMLIYNTIAGEREGKPPVIMLKKGENLWE